MQSLRNDSVLILDGLLVDEFDSVVAAARRIAEHPRIPASQIALVAAELGEEMPSFKQLDTLVHDLAVSIESAANDKDGIRAAADYQQMLGGCLACHAKYRQRVAAVLQPSNDE
jgi:cytochrome c556